MKLTGKSVVITGAARGIGRALAIRCADAGARVAICDLDAGELGAVANELGDPHMAVEADVGSVEQTQELIRGVQSRFGAIDVFCANAGVAVGGDPITTSEDEWERALTVNLRSHVIATRLLLPEWLERGEGYFVSTASAAGLLTQIGSAPYSVTKHAAVAFAEWLSVTYGHRGIRVSCVCPMGVNTAMLDGDGDGALDVVGRRVVRSAGIVVEPEQVADEVVAAMEQERFLVLPHPEVLTFFKRKAADYERWLAGMRRLQAGVEEQED